MRIILVNGYRHRYSHRASWVPNPTSAVGYVHCGFPMPHDYWGDAYYPRLRASPPSKNPLYIEQKNLIREYSRRHGHELWQTYCDLKENEQISLSRRLGLVKLAATIRTRGIRVVLVDNAMRLAPQLEEIALLLRYFKSIKVMVVEASSGLDLTEEPYYAQFIWLGDAKAVDDAARSVNSFKRRVTLLMNKGTAGRRPFGGSQHQLETLERLLDLRRALPKDAWRKRGETLCKRRSFQRIAEILNEERRAAGSGGPWTASAVRSVIRRRKPQWLQG